MNAFMTFVRGSVKIKLTGVSPERCLNRFTQCSIGFWDVQLGGELELSCRIFARDAQAAEQAAARMLCAAEVTERFGLRAVFYGVLQRPALLVGLLLAAAIALFLQNFVWTLNVSGNETVPTAQILRELEDLGVGFGTFGPKIDSQAMKNEMLNRIPELSWLAVNRRGGVVSVLVAERSAQTKPVDRRDPANVVARSTGLITSMSVLNGFSAVEVGQAVRQGQLLVSGCADWDTHTQITRAIAEIYALTLRSGQTVIPQSYAEKTETGDTHRCVSLIFGRKRIKIFGNSSNSSIGCDKIIRREQLTLPGGITLPVTLEIETMHSYETTQAVLPKKTAQALLQQYVHRTVMADLIAGTILDESCQLRQENGCYVLSSSISCEEMISKTEPIFIIGKDETIGTDD